MMSLCFTEKVQGEGADRGAVMFNDGKGGSV